MELYQRKHVLYENLSKPPTVAGIPRKGLLLAVLIATPFLAMVYLFTLLTDEKHEGSPLLALFIGALIFGFMYLIIFIQAKKDPDSLDISFQSMKLPSTRSLNKFKGRRYAA